MSELQPCGTRAAYNRHRAHGEEACEPCHQARRDYYAKNRIMHGVKPRTATDLSNLLEDIKFLLSCGEGEHAILRATGYLGRPNTLRLRLNKHGHQAIAMQIFNTWELAA